MPYKDPAKRRACDKARNAARREWKRAYMKAYHAARPEEQREKKRAYQKAHYAAHPEACRAIVKKSDTARHGGISTDGPCAVCGWDLTPNERHRLVAGGPYAPDNVVLLCPNHHRLAHQGATPAPHLRCGTSTASR